VDIQLAPKEFAVLLLLAKNEGKVFTAEKLYEDVWKLPMADDDHSVKNVIYRLRKRLEAGNSGYSVVMYRKEGYMFEKIN
jgi:DNA-binding response OmpR family regulator